MSLQEERQEWLDLLKNPAWEGLKSHFLLKSKELFVELREKAKEGNSVNTFVLGKMDTIEEIMAFPHSEIDRISEDIDKNS
jgi:hypothetical protein